METSSLTHHRLTLPSCVLSTEWFQYRMNRNVVRRETFDSINVYIWFIFSDQNSRFVSQLMNCTILCLSFKHCLFVFHRLIAIFFYSLTDCVTVCKNLYHFCSSVGPNFSLTIDFMDYDDDATQEQMWNKEVIIDYEKGTILWHHTNMPFMQRTGKFSLWKCLKLFLKGKCWLAWW